MTSQIPLYVLSAIGHGLTLVAYLLFGGRSNVALIPVAYPCPAPTVPVVALNPAQQLRSILLPTIPWVTFDRFTLR
jgi:hypothetical protein